MDDDSDIEANHWDQDLNSETDSTKTVTDSGRDFDDYIFYASVLFTMLLVTGWFFNIGPYQQNPQIEFTEVTLEETEDEVVLELQNVNPHFKYISVQVGDEEREIYNDAKITYDPSELQNQGVNKITVVGTQERLERVSFRRSRPREEQVLLRVFELNSGSNE